MYVFLLEFFLFRKEYNIHFYYFIFYFILFLLYRVNYLKIYNRYKIIFIFNIKNKKYKYIYRLF